MALGIAAAAATVGGFWSRDHGMVRSGESPGYQNRPGAKPRLCGSPWAAGKPAVSELAGSGAYASDMSVMREELHHLIDQLPKKQVVPVLALVRKSLPVGEDGETLWPHPSFVGTLADGKGDVAARSQEILREEMAATPGDHLGYRAAVRCR